MSTEEIEKRMLSTGQRLTRIARERRTPLRFLPAPSTASTKEKPFPQRAFVMDLEGDFRVVERDLFGAGSCYEPTCKMVALLLGGLLQGECICLGVR